MNRTPPGPARRVLGVVGRGQAGRAAVAVASGLGGQLAALGLLATSGWLVTTASLRPPVLTLSAAIATVRVLALVRGAGRYGERLASHDLALRGLARLRVWAFRHLEPLVPGGLADGAGDALSRVVADVDAVQDLLVRVAVPAATGLVAAAAAVAIAAAVLPLAGAVLAGGLLATGVAVPAAARSLGGRLGPAVSAWRGRVTSVVVESATGATDLVALGAAGSAVEAMDRAESELARAAHRVARVGGASEAATSLAATATLVAVMGVAARAVAGGHLPGVSAAVLGAVVLAAFDAVGPVPRALAQVDGALGSARRVGMLADAAPPVPATARAGSAAPPAATGSVPAGGRAADGPTGAARPAATGDPGRAVTYELRGLCVHRPGSRRPALDGVDLAIGPGRRVAVAGPSGAGKTTLVLAMLRFVAPTGGLALLAGTDAAALDPDGVRSTIAWAPQDPHVFGTTVAANLRLARPDASDEDLGTVLNALGMGPWLDGLDGGLQAVLGEHGATVSGGERQRLGVARALLADRPLLVLDEPTANLDPGTEDLVRRSVLRASEGRGLLWVTHRLAGLEAFDEVVVLDGGRVAERGTAARLATSAGAFARLLADQLADATALPERAAPPRRPAAPPAPGTAAAPAAPATSPHAAAPPAPAPQATAPQATELAAELTPSAAAQLPAVARDALAGPLRHPSCPDDNSAWLPS